MDDEKWPRLSRFCPGLWLLEVLVDDFTVRGALIRGQERVVIWDTLSHPQDMQPLLPLLFNREMIVAYSHADWDHVWGTVGLPYSSQIHAWEALGLAEDGRSRGWATAMSGATSPMAMSHPSSRLVIGHSSCRERFSNDVPEYLQKRRQAEPGRWDEVILVPPNLTFTDALTLELGEVTLSLHHLPGHTADSVVAWLPEWGVLLGGDAVESPLPVTAEDSPLELWIDGLRRWEQEPELRAVIPAHGPPGGRELLQKNIAYLEDMLGQGEGLAPEEMDDFYRKVHQQNLQHWREKE